MTVPALTARARLSLAAAAAGAVVALAGCQPGQAGAAAVVDGERIAVADVERSLEGLRSIGAQQGGGAAARAVLQQKIQGIVLERVARAENVTVSRGDVDRLVASVRQQAGGEEQLRQFLAQQSIAPGDLDAVARINVLFNRIAVALVPGSTATDEQRAAALQQRVGEEVRRLRIEINPRYGAWTGSEVGEPLDDLSRPPAQG